MALVVTIDSISIRESVKSEEHYSCARTVRDVISCESNFDRQHQSRTFNHIQRDLSIP